MAFQLQIIDLKAFSMNPRGRPPMFGKAMASWQIVRRHRERQSGKPDPVLIDLGISTFQDQGKKPCHIKKSK